MQPRAQGGLSLTVKHDYKGSAIERLVQSGASRMLFPAGDCVEGVILNTAGGVTGGDHFATECNLRPKSSARLTTQASERLYRANDVQAGRIETRVHLDRDSHLKWLPQESIIFNGANIRRTFTADLASTAKLLFVEPIIFGRLLMGETLDSAEMRDSVTIRRDGALLYRDTAHWTGDIAAQLDRPAIGNGARAGALMLYVAPDADAHLPALQRLSPNVSLIRDGLLAARLLARDGFELRQSLIPILSHFTDLPRCWSL